MPGAEKDDNIKKPQDHTGERDKHRLDGAEIEHRLIRSRYEAGTFAAFHAEAVTMQVVDDIIADPAKYGSQGIKEALQLISRDLRDLGGSLQQTEVDFEEFDPALGAVVGFRFMVSRSGYDLNVLSFAGLSEEYVRFEDSQILDQSAIDTLTEQGRERVPILIAADSALSVERSALASHSLQFGLWSDTTRDYCFTYDDEIGQAKNMRGAEESFEDDQIVFQREYPIGHHTSYSIPTPLAEIYLKEDGHGERTFTVAMDADAPIVLSRNGSVPGTVRLTPSETTANG